MKKILTGILATVAILACASACKTNKPNSSEENSSVVSGNQNSSSSTTIEDEELQTAADFLKSKEKNLNKEVRANYTVDAKVLGYPITWTVDVSAGVSIGEAFTDEDGNNLVRIVVDKTLEEDLTYVLTATITNESGESISVSFTRKVLKMASAVPQLITAAPVEGTAYKLYCYQGNNKTDMYFTGAMSSYYFKASDKADEGVDVYVEYLEGSTTEFYPYFLDGTNTKMYIGVEAGDGHDNIKFSGNPVSVFKWDATLGTITTHLDSNASGQAADYYLGSYKTYDTIQASKTSYASGDSNFVGGLAEMVSSTELPAETKFAAIKEVLSVQENHTLDKTVELTTADDRYPDVTITWASSDTSCATVNGSALNLTIPETKTTVTLTATLTCGDETDTKTFTLTLGPKTVAPAADASASDIVNAAFSLAAGETLGNYTLTGKITKVNTAYDSSFSNVTVTIEVEGKSIECYRLKGTGADVIKAGDTITVTGTLKNFNGKVEFDSGCNLDSYTVGEDSGNGEEGGNTETSELDITKGFTIADWADANEWADATAYLTLTNNGVTITLSGTQVGTYGMNTGKYYTNGEDWRIYQNESPSITISVASGSIASVKVTYEIKNTGVLICGETQIASDEVYTVNASSVVFSVGNTDSDTKKGQVKITAIQVILGDGNGTENGGNTDDKGDNNEGGETTTTTWSVVTAPAAATAYKFGMVQSGKTYYLTGEMVNTYYFATTDNVSEALDFYLEETDGGYYLYCTIEQKTYVNIVTSDTYVNIKYQTTASTVYTIDSATGELRTTVNDTAYTIGTYGTYTSVSPVKAAGDIHCTFYAESTTENGGDTDDKGDNNEGGDNNEVKDVVLEENKAYNFYVEATDGKTYYLNGELNEASTGQKLATTENESEAVTIYAEIATDGYKFYIKKDDVKSYIYLFKDANSKNALTYSTENSTVFSYNKDKACWEAPSATNNLTIALIAYKNETDICIASISTHKPLTIKEALNEGGDSTDTPVTPTYTTLTIPEALELVATYEHNTYSEDKYYLSGIVVKIANATYGNCYICDENGNTILVYGMYDENNTRYDSMTTKPAVGDQVKILTVLGQYNSTVQAKNATLVELTNLSSSEVPATVKFLIEEQTFVFSTSIVENGSKTVATKGTTYTDVVISYVSDKDCAVVDNTNGTITYTLGEEATTVTITVTFAIGETTKTKTITVSLAAASTEPWNYADFSSLNNNVDYTSFTTSDNWFVVNAAIQSGGNSDKNPICKTLLGSDQNTKAVCLNGKTSAVGSITSATLSGGITKLSFKYGFAFAENKGVSLHIAIKDAEGNVLAETDCINTSTSKNTAYSFDWDLTDKNITGTFVIVITNNSPSQNSGNKDRTSIWNIAWLNAETEEEA